MKEHKFTLAGAWEGGLAGKGRITCGQLSVPVSVPEGLGGPGVGTNPEELLGAAHAGCFSMAFSGQLGAAGLTADRIATEATVSLEKTDSGFAITAVHLVMTAKVPGATQQQFETAANNAKAGCPVSKLFNTKITLDAKLEQ